VHGSGLGVLRSDTDMTDDGGRDVPSFLPGGVQPPLVAVTKADSRSTVHRRAWLDVIALTLPGEDGAARQHRLVGLFPATAGAVSVREVPLVRRRVADVIERSGVAPDAHTGKGLLEVLETYPRDELFQVSSDELLPVAMAVLYLQERRQTRLFLRRDPAGRFWSALVYLPRDRYTTEVRTRMQELLLHRLGGTSIEYTARSTESVLARLHFVVRMPVGRRGGPKAPDVDVETLQKELATASRRWTDDLRDALTARYGTADTEKMLARGVADAFPAAYQEDFPA
jgi:glutamate dehydrogenase